MTKRPANNVAASVQAKLLARARERGDDFQLLLLRYANERLLFRLASSAHAKSFVLKGAALFTYWTGQPHRASRDLDFLGFGESSEAHLKRVFAEILEVAVVDNGLRFEPSRIEVGPIREDQEYGGATPEGRLTLSGPDRIYKHIGWDGVDAIEYDGLATDWPVRTVSRESARDLAVEIASRFHDPLRQGAVDETVWLHLRCDGRLWHWKLNISATRRVRRLPLCLLLEHDRWLGCSRDLLWFDRLPAECVSPIDGLFACPR